jgi:hemolysin III
VSPKEETKPLLRGYFHLVAFFMAIGAGIALITKSHTLPATYSSIIYAITLVLLFGASALYHRPQWSHKFYVVMRRIDHSAIFLLIAGTATPLVVMGLDGKQEIKLLAIIWITAGIGVLQAVLWTRGPKWIRASLYIIAGWVVAPYFPEIKASLGNGGEKLILLGGLIYTLGAVVYALKKPNPFPKVFGYHEIFHIMVIVAASFHFAAIYRLVGAY